MIQVNSPVFVSFPDSSAKILWSGYVSLICSTIICSEVLSTFDTKSFRALVSTFQWSGLSIDRNMKSPALRAAFKAIEAMGRIELSEIGSEHPIAI